MKGEKSMYEKWFKRLYHIESSENRKAFFFATKSEEEFLEFLGNFPKDNYDIVHIVVEKSDFKVWFWEKL